MKRQQYYVTTPIYYVNGNPHIGHAHTTVMGDIFKRAMKMCGISVFYTTGVDEHGQKNRTEVENSGLTAKQYLDRQSRKFKDLFALLTVEYDFFVRTSGPEHKKAVSVFLQKLYDSGQIIKKEYTGLYCSGCEQFKTDSDLDEEGKCPDHHVKPLLEKETNYFFPLEPYRDWLAEYIMGNRSWINPESYRSQVLDMLPDLCMEGIRILFEAGWPVIPGTAEKVLACLGGKVPGASGEHSFVPLALETGRKIAMTEMLFPRVTDNQG